MLKKIKAFFKKCDDRRFYKNCYRNMDARNLRTYDLKFTCAGGWKISDNAALPERCLSCPYFRDIRDNDDWA